MDTSCGCGCETLSRASPPRPVTSQAIPRQPFVQRGYNAARQLPFPGRRLQYPHAYAARVPVHRPAADRDRQADLSTVVHERNAVRLATGMKALYLRLVNRGIKLTILKLVSYGCVLYRTIKLIHSKIDSYADNLDRKIRQLNSKIPPDSQNVDRKINLFYSKIDSCNDDLQKAKTLLDSKIVSYRNDLEKRIRQLNSVLRLTDHDLNEQIQRLNSKATLYSDRLNRKLKPLNSKLTSFYNSGKKIKHRRSKKGDCKCVIKSTMCGFVCKTFRAKV